MAAPKRNRDQSTGARRGATRREPARNFDRLAAEWKRLRELPWRWLGLGLLLPALLVVVVEGATLALERLDRKVGVIEVTGELRNLTPGELHRALADLTAQSFFAVDLREAQRRVEAFSWVASSRVERVWPNKLQVWVKEHEPIALWGEQALLSRDGRVFEPADRSAYVHLPRLDGPEGSQELLWRNYLNWSRELGALGMTLVSVRLAPRGAWEMNVGEGLLIKLGREDLEGKMARLQRIFKAQLRDRIPEIEVLDARYANGLAVRWREESREG